FFSSRTTTATVSNLSMDAPNRPWAIRYALPTTEALYEFSTWVRWGKSMTEVEPVVVLENDETNPCFVCGPRTPRGLQLAFRRVGNRVETDLLADVTMEGWPGRLHSGILYTAMLEAANWTVFVIAGRIGVPVRTSALTLKRWVPTRTRPRLVGRSESTAATGGMVALEAVRLDTLCCMGLEQDVL